MNHLPSFVSAFAAGGSGPQPWGAGRGAGGPGRAARGDGCGGRCCAPTALRCSPRGRAAKLATLASRAALGQSPRVRSTKRAARADPEAALLGAADITPRGPAWPAGAASRPPRLRPAAACRESNVGGVHGDVGREHRSRDGRRAQHASSYDSPRLSERSSPSGRCWPGGRRQRCSDRRPGRRPLPELCQEPAWLQRSGCRRRTPQRCLQRRVRRGGSPAAGVPVRSREAQQCRPARAARFVLLTRRDCPSAARAASVASFAARPALRASQGTPAQRGPAPARRRRAARPFARAFAGVFAQALPRPDRPCAARQSHRGK